MAAYIIYVSLDVYVSHQMNVIKGGSRSLYLHPHTVRWCTIMNSLRIHTQIHSRYQVLDASGQLPFGIVYGFCRRSPTDTDPRPLRFETAGSILDVPYALANGLLTIHERNPADLTQWIDVDLGPLKGVAAKESEYLALPSPVDRIEHWREAFTVYVCYIDVNGILASILKPGKKYTIRLASANLGVKRWVYGDQKQVLDSDEESSHASEAGRLVNSHPTASNATFTVVKSLPWPPRIETKMRLCVSSSASDTAPAAPAAPADTKSSNGIALEVSVVNTGSESVTVQTRGHQRFLVPWGPFQPESIGYDNGLRIIDATPDKQPRTASLQVINSATGHVVQRNIRHPTAPLMTSASARQQPKVENVLVLKPGAGVVRKVDIGALVGTLKDGQYKVRMQPTGCRWWPGGIGEEECEDGRVPVHFVRALIPPLMLESHDEVELCIRDGKIE